MQDSTPYSPDKSDRAIVKPSTDPDFIGAEAALKRAAAKAIARARQAGLEPVIAIPVDDSKKP